MINFIAKLEATSQGSVSESFHLFLCIPWLSLATYKESLVDFSEKVLALS